MATTENRTSIVLFEDSNEQALVQMKDGDKFFVAVADAARACQVIDSNVKGFAHQFNELVNTTLVEWVEQHRSKIKSARINVRDRDILFVVMQKGVEFDRSLSDALTDLDLAVANSQDLNLIDLEVLAIPAVSEDSCKAFLSSDRVYTYPNAK